MFRLPLDVTCDQCIFQWTYVAGNNWGQCSNGTSGLGCGPQETFRSCSDIRIVPHPLLSNNNQREEESYEEEEYYYDDDEDGDLSIDFNNIVNPLQDGPSELEKKKMLLKKKQELLKKVLKRLESLIMLSQSGGDEGSAVIKSPWEAIEEMRAAAENKKIFKPKEHYEYYYDEEEEEEASRSGSGGQVLPWWEKILSNKHR